MTSRSDHEPLQVKRTRTSATWMALSVAIGFFILLVVFIAQNNRQVPLHFFGAAGRVSEALALVVSALVGATIVVAVGIGRIAQLRLTGWRHNRSAMQDQGDGTTSDPNSGPVSQTPRR
jgi:uncharacterized integral membrane protein